MQKEIENSLFLEMLTIKECLTGLDLSLGSISATLERLRSAECTTVNLPYPSSRSLQEGGNYVGYFIVRTYSAGVFAGEIVSRNGREVVMKNARRLWYWEGAASLSQLAMEGVKKPKECKFPCEVDRVELLEVVEILTCTDAAKQSIKNVPIWAAE